MPYSIRWLIPDELVYIHYSGAVDSKELRECLEKLTEMMNGSSRPLVHVINDVGDITEAMSYKDSMQVIRDLGPHEQAGWMLNIREKNLIVKMGSAFGSSLFKLRFRAFDTLDEAIEHLKTVDLTLSWSEWQASHK